MKHVFDLSDFYRLRAVIRKALSSYWFCILTINFGNYHCFFFRCAAYSCHMCIWPSYGSSVNNIFAKKIDHFKCELASARIAGYVCSACAALISWVMLKQDMKLETVEWKKVWRCINSSTQVTFSRQCSKIFLKASWYAEHFHRSFRLQLIHMKWKLEWKLMLMTLVGEDREPLLVYLHALTVPLRVVWGIILVHVTIPTHAATQAHDPVYCLTIDLSIKTCHVWVARPYAVETDLHRMNGRHQPLVAAHQMPRYVSGRCHVTEIDRYHVTETRGPTCLVESHG